MGVLDFDFASFMGVLDFASALGVFSRTVKLVYTEVMAELVPFLDTHETIRKLVKSGMPESQAETVVGLQVQFLEHNFATKTEIEAFRRETKIDIETLRQETKADIETLRQETKAEIETLRQETRANIETTNANIEVLRLETRADIAATNANIDTLRQETGKLIALSKNDTIRWFVGVNIGLAALLIATYKYL